MKLPSRLRASEWVLLAYFLYVAAAAAVFPVPPGTVLRALLVLAGVAATFAILARPSFHYARDWAPLVLILAAYREMDWFSSAYKARHLERLWLGWDHRFLFDLGFRDWIESLGPVLPWLLELAYFLVYGVGAFALAALYLGRHRERVNQFLCVYLVGTLVAYSLFPYFPSDPPRVLFAGMDLPRYLTATRRLNLLLVSDYGIHSSVFPSAHVSSAFSAAWGLMRFLPEYPRAGLIALAYAVFVSVATVYGRYHYAADALAGLAVSLIALMLTLRLRPGSALPA